MNLHSKAVRLDFAHLTEFYIDSPVTIFVYWAVNFAALPATKIGNLKHGWETSSRRNRYLPA